MKNRVQPILMWVATLLLISCLIPGTVLSVFAEGGVIDSPATGEKPSATPWILGGVMVLCLVVIVLLFLPKKKGKAAQLTEKASEAADSEE